MTEQSGASEKSAVSRILYLLIGIALGTVGAVLFAPKSGAETREDMRQGARKATDYAQAKAQEIQERAGAAADEAKEAITAKRDQVIEAIDAGRKTYKQEIAKGKSAGDA